MDDGARIALGEFEIDVRARRLWHGRASVALRPKPWDLLLCLLQRPGRVVLKDEIAATVWPEVVVGEDSISKAVRELRTALCDDARRPRYLETVHRIGIRLIADVSEVPGTPSRASGTAKPARSPVEGIETPIDPASGSLPVGRSDTRTESPGIAGRGDELALLREGLAKARDGRRQVVFLSGEGGIGKSTVVRSFLDSIESVADAPRVLFGQSAEGMAVADAYAPMLDALEMLRQDQAGSVVDDLLAAFAPEWAAQLPARAATKSGASDGEGSAAARMLREGVLLIEALAADRPLVLVLEDAHAADHATIELLATLARRPGSARLLVIATFRRAEAAAAGHPVASLSAELELKGFASASTMVPFHADDVLRVLATRFGRLQQPEELAAMLLARSGGNPLFLTALIDYLVSSGTLVDDEGRWSLTTPVAALADVVPDRLRLLVDALVVALAPSAVEMLEAAAVEGLEFDARAVAAAVGVDPARVEEACDALAAEERLLRFRDETRWNDGTRGARYEFVHELDREVLSARLAPSRRRRIHLRIAERLEAGFGRDSAAAIFGGLATHFLGGGDDAKAVRYFLKAAERANRRGAHHDAVAALRQALPLVDTPDGDTPQKWRQLRVLFPLIGTVSLIKGFVDPEMEVLLERGRKLAAELDAEPASFMIVLGIYTARIMQLRLDEALESGTRMLEIADAVGMPALRGVALGAKGWALLEHGDLAGARDDFEQSLEINTDAVSLSEIGSLGSLPEMRMFALLGRAYAGAILGDVEAAIRDVDAASARAEAGRPVDRIVTLSLTSFLRAVLGDDARAAVEAGQARRVADESGEGPPWSLLADLTAVLSSPDFTTEAAREVHDAMTSRRYLLTDWGSRVVAASRLLAREDVAGARAMMDGGSGLPWAPLWSAERLRVQAELLAREAGSSSAEVEALLRESLQVARAQGARLWELRSARSLADFLVAHERAEEASAELERAGLSTRSSTNPPTNQPANSSAHFPPKP